MTAATSELQRLMDLARSLRPRFTPKRPLPPLLFVTDPERTPDPAAIATRLPAGCGVIYRTFGAPDALSRAQALKAIAVERGLVLLIGADADLARACGANGVHLPETLTDKAVALRRDHPDWVLTAAAHSLAAAERAYAAGCDAALASTVFASHSPSAAEPLGAASFADLVRAAPLPLYALGGVTIRTAPDLAGSGAQGLAMVEGLVEAVRI